MTPTPTPTPLDSPDVYEFLYRSGYICNVETNWTSGTTQQVKCDYLDATNPDVRGKYELGASGFYYYSSQGQPISVGTVFHNTYPPYSVISSSLNGNYMYSTGVIDVTWSGGIPNYGNDKFVVTVTNGVVTAMTNLNDLGSCTPTTC
jgi:hypothetical protein